MSDVTVENTPPVQPPAGENIINLTDLQNILVVFDLASNRGAFRGNELEPVGQLYNKISKFVQAAMPPQTAEGQTETQGV